MSMHLRQERGGGRILGDDGGVHLVGVRLHLLTQIFLFRLELGIIREDRIAIFFQFSALIGREEAAMMMLRRGRRGVGIVLGQKRRGAGETQHAGQES